MNLFKAVPKNQVLIKPLDCYLAEQENISNKLDTVLKQEFECLKERRMQDLPQLSSFKSELMVKLQSNDQRLKLHPDAASLKTLFKQRVDVIKQKLVLCKAQNEANGKLINLNMQSVHRLSSMLMGVRDAFTRNMTYNAKGAASARGPMRLSISA